MYLKTLLTALVTLAWALSRDEGLVSQAVGKGAGWCRDNLGCSEQPHGAKNGKCDQFFVVEGTESLAEILVSRVKLRDSHQHFSLWQPPGRKQSSPLGSSSSSASGAARFPSCRLVTWSRGTHSSPHLSPLKENFEEKELNCSSAFLHSRWAALWITPAPGSVVCTLHPQAQLHGFPVPLHICKCSAVQREHPGLCGMSREQPVPLQVQRSLSLLCPPPWSTGTEGARKGNPPPQGSGAEGRRWNPPSSRLSHTALALCLPADQENWLPLRRAPFSLTGPLSAVLGWTASEGDTHWQTLWALHRQSLPAGWEIHQWLHGERPCVFAHVCYGSPKRRMKL